MDIDFFGKDGAIFKGFFFGILISMWIGVFLGWLAYVLSSIVIIPLAIAMFWPEKR